LIGLLKYEIFYNLNDILFYKKNNNKLKTFKLNDNKKNVKKMFERKVKNNNKIKKF